MLSKRLLMVASKVEKGSIIADIGSDHALLPIYLSLNNQVKRAYAIDNKEGPLISAKANIKTYRLEDVVIPILGDGLDKVSLDVDTIIVAGMGYHTLVNFLNRANLSLYKRIIVQINKDMPKFRKYLSDHHYTILDEDIVLDDLYYEVVVFNCLYHKTYTQEEILFGPINLKHNQNILKEYVSNRIKQIEEIEEKHHISQVLKDLKNKYIAYLESNQ